MASQLLLLSSTAEPVWNAIDTFLGTNRTIYFAPYALSDYDGYATAIQDKFKHLGVSIVGLHTFADPRDALREATTIFVGGGNSFRLLKTLQELDLIDLVRQRVSSGELRYMGSSAGTNMACPSLRTTNDMPIVQPASFASFGLVPFQINPHYIEADPRLIYRGETRDDRLAEFLEENDVPVLGLREGACLRRDGERLYLAGTIGGKLFRRNQDALEVGAGTDLSWLLDAPARFDVQA